MIISCTCVPNFDSRSLEMSETNLRDGINDNDNHKLKIINTFKK